MLKKLLTKEELLGKINDRDIFRMYFGEFNFHESFSSIFREDNNPSAGFFESKDGLVIYHDFRTGEKLNAIDFVMKLYGLSFGKAIEKIAKDFGLIERGTGELSVKEVRRYRPQVKKEKRYEVIVGLSLSDLEKEFWDQYKITWDELKENMISPVRELSVNHYTIENPNGYIRFVYKINGTDGKQYIKIYTPEAEHKYKWIGNVPFTEPFGFMELPYVSSTLWITKGQKDRVILKKYFSDVIAIQAESKDALTEELVDKIKDKYTRVNCWFDNDPAGLEALKYFNLLGFNPYHLPKHLLSKGIKDPSDFVKHFGLTVFETYLQHNKLL